jgi:PAS domain S-box-containing protein
VDSVTSAGDIAPIVAQVKITILGRESPPKPEQRTVAELDAGVADSTWVVTEGVLHPCDQTWTRVCFRVFDGKSLAWLVVPEKENVAAQSLTGATVRVTGVSGIHLDGANRRVAAQLFVNSLSDIHIEEPPLLNSLASTPIPLGNLGKLDLDRRFLPEIHVRGTVTWASPTKLFLQDGSGTLFVETAGPASIHVGNTVDAVGFPNYGEYGPELLDSNVRLSEIQSDTSSIAPIETTAEDVLKRSLNGKQVRLKAHLISQSTSTSGYVYQLEDGDQRFSATLLRTESTSEFVGLSRNSDLQLTGVAVIRSATAEWPECLMVLVSSPADIVVLGGNGWLTPKRGIVIFGSMALCVILPFVWVTQLRRTVRKQTTMMRARLEHEMHLETKFKRLFGRNLAGVFSWRSDGAIVDCNMAFAKMLGFPSHEELIGRSYWEFQVDPTQREQVFGALREGALSNQEACLRRDDGAIVYLLQNITPVQTPLGTLYETTAIDVSQLRKNQAELQKAKDAAVYESLNDSLTGLPNRRHLLDRLEFLIEKAGGKSGIIALL